MFRILFSSHGERAFGVLTAEAQERVIQALQDLAQDRFWYRRVKKLGGSESRYRLRVRRWRVLFSLKIREIEVSDIFLKKGRSDYRRRKF